MGDGALDLAVSDGSSNGDGVVESGVGVASTMGRAGFARAVQYGSGGNTPFGIAAGDLNGDGHPRSGRDEPRL